MPPPEDRPLRLLISFAPQDQELKDQLVRHLQVLVRFAGIELWEADHVRAGDNWRQEADDALARADVALVLISSDFLASDLLQDVELPKLFRRREHGGLKVIPVLLRSCLWQAHPWLKDLHPLPRGGKPIGALSGDERDAVLTEVVREIVGPSGATFGDVGCMIEEKPPSLQFVAITIDQANAKWSQAPQAMMYDVSYVFRKGGLALVDPALDVTVLNNRQEPMVLTRIGIRIVSIALRTRVAGVPYATEIPKTHSYVIEIDDEVARILCERIPQGQSRSWSYGPVEIDYSYWLTLPNPIRIPPLEPYRYGLLLKNYEDCLPNFCCVALLATTNRGESVSPLIEMRRW